MAKEPSILEGVSKTPQSETLLSDVAQEIESNVPEELRENYDAMINATSELLWGESYDIVGKTVGKEIKKAKDIPQAVAGDVAQAIGIVIRKSGQEADDLAQAAMVASQVIMLHILEYVSKKTRIRIDERILAETSHETTKMILKLFGITKQKFQESMRAMQTEALDQEEARLNEEEAGVVPFDESQELPAEEGVPVEEEMPVEGEVPPPAEAAPPAEGLPIEGAV